MSGHSPRSRRLCTFQVEDLVLGIDVTRVQEVVRGRAITPVPLAPPIFRGLINLRGQIVTALDLRRRLDLPPACDGQETVHLIVTLRGTTFCVVVDAMGDVVEVDPGGYSPPPDTLPSPHSRLFEGAYPLGDRLLLVLDCQSLADESDSFGEPSSSAET